MRQRKGVNLGRNFNNEVRPEIYRFNVNVDGLPMPVGNHKSKEMIFQEEIRE
jgi:hypothetical protein